MTGMPDEHGQRLAAWLAYQPKTGQPVQADLRQAAMTFAPQAAAAFRSIMPAGGPASVDSGDPELDHALTQVLELITDIMAVLDQRMSRLAPAGSAFASSWRRDSAAAEALAAVVVQAAAIIDGLAVELAAIQNALEEEAYVASRYGVTIGTDGRPPLVPAPHADPSGQHWTVAYKLAHERAMTEARQARQQAARQLAHLHKQVKLPRPLAMSPAGPEFLPASYAARGC
jgi:hypothetical protein